MAELNDALFDASAAGSLPEVTRLLGEGAEAFYQKEETGCSVLMAAAGQGHLEVVQLLLQRGAPWNALDRKGLCAGEYAVNAGHQAVSRRPSHGRCAPTA